MDVLNEDDEFLTAEEFKNVCRVIWGDSAAWSYGAAEALNVNRRTVTRWGSGRAENLPPAWLKPRLREILQQQRQQLHDRIEAAANILGLERI